MKQEKEPVIERIFQLIEQRYPSRSAAARAWGINVNTIKNYYQRKDLAPTPRPNQLLKIAEVEGVSMDWLLQGTGTAPTSTSAPTPAPKNPKRAGSSSVDKTLMEMISFLSDEEKRGLLEVIARKGVETVLYLLDEDNIELMRQDPVVKAKILGKQVDPTQEASPNDQEKRERASDGELQTTEHNLASPVKKRQVR